MPGLQVNPLDPGSNLSVFVTQGWHLCNNTHSRVQLLDDMVLLALWLILALHRS